MKRLRLICLIALLVVVANTAAYGGIIYQDNFDGSSSTNLNGLPPDIDNNGGTNNWQAYSGYKANGTMPATSVNQGAWLPFAPVAGNVYTLSVSMTNVGPDGTSASWYALGFAKALPVTLETGNNRFVESPTLGRAWMIFRANNPGANTNQYFLGNDASGTASSGAWTTGSPLNEGGDMDMKIVLDTTPATWTATFFAKRPADASYTQVSTGAMPLLLQDIQAVGIARTTSTLSGNVKFFELSVVPEPASAVLAIVGLVFVGGALNRRRLEPSLCVARQP